MTRIIRTQTLHKVVPALELQDAVVIYRGTGRLEDLKELTQVIEATPLTDLYAEGTRELKVGQTLNNSIGGSSGPHPPHQDGVYLPIPPDLLMLQTVSEDRNGGGIGLYWPTSELFRKMPDSFYETLRDFPVAYTRQREDGLSIDAYTATIVCQKNYETAPILRYRNDTSVWPQLMFDASKQERNRFEQALRFLHNFFQTTQPVEVIYEAGDVAIFSNLTFLHGRTAILDAKRHVRRVWLRSPNSGERGLVVVQNSTHY